MRTRRGTPEKGHDDGRVDRLRQVYGAVSDASLAVSMKRSKTTISSWRARGVPDYVCVDAAKERSVSLEWLLHGPHAKEQGAEYGTEQGGGRLAPDEVAMLEMYRQLSGDQKAAVKATLDAFASTRARKKPTGS